jgi:hypothetical protein
LVHAALVRFTHHSFYDQGFVKPLSS